MPFSSCLSHFNRIGQVVKEMWNATSSCCEIKSCYSSRKSRGILN
jgi:hypothetical protein